MRNFIIAGAALLGFASLAAAPAPAAAQESAAPSRGTAAQRSEIARILAADNIDNGNMMPAQVAATIRAIPRGGAPADFWGAYRAHVAAWERLGEAVTRAEAVVDAAEAKGGGDDAAFRRAAEELLEAEAAIGTTFDEVERIATLYGVPLPASAEPVDLRGTV
ncbi:MAG TPA: hypothetical protein VGB79_08050 [Allosphingosinicella sp.]|jgi:hypothetical protein